MPTREEFLELVQKELPQLFSSGVASLQKWQQWVIDGLSFSKSHWFTEYEQTGLTQLLKNKITGFYNLPSVGYDQPDNRQVYGDQLRAYVARAQAVLDSETAMLTILQTQRAQATDDTTRNRLDTEISLQMSTIKAGSSNLATQKETLAEAISAGRAL